MKYKGIPRRVGVMSAAMESADLEPLSCELAEFYRETGVLVAGEKGLITTVLIEKLLRSCPDLSHVFLLAEKQPDMRPQDLVDKLLSSPYFDELRHQRGDFSSKVVGVTGDVKEKCLGMSDVDRRRLAKEVGVVFYVIDANGADIDHSLNDHILRDVRGPQGILAICRSFVKLKSVVFVSPVRSVLSTPTAGEYIFEQIYEPHFSPSHAIDLALHVKGNLLASHVAGLLGKWPASRTYLKGIGEHAVKVYGQGLPVAVVRSPAVLTTEIEAWKRAVSRPGEAALDDNLTTVPCDMTVNCMIASARDIQGDRCSSITRVYNCLMSPTTANSKPPQYVQCPMTAQGLVNYVVTILHTLLSIVISPVLFALAKEERLIPLCTVLDKLLQDGKSQRRVVQFSVNNVNRMWRSMSPWDRREFNFDLRAVHRRIEQARAVKSLQSRFRRDPGLAERQNNKSAWRPGVSQCVFFGLTFWLAWAVISPLNVIKTGPATSVVTTSLPSQFAARNI